MSITTKVLPTGDIVGTSDTQTLTGKTITQPILTLEQGAAVAPTAEGRIAWDTDDNRLKVGDGSTTKTFSPDNLRTKTVTFFVANSFTVPNGITNMAAAITESLGANRRTKEDLTGYSQVRVVAAVSTAGSTGSVIRIQYSTDNSSYSEIGASGNPNCPLDTGNTVAASSWVDLASGAKADVFLRVVTEGGDGTADPSIWTLYAQFR